MERTRLMPWLGKRAAHALSVLFISVNVLTSLSLPTWDSSPCDSTLSCAESEQPLQQGGHALLQVSQGAQTTHQKHKGGGILLLQKMQSYIQTKGQVGLSPTERLEVQQIREILNMDLLPSLLQAAEEAQAEIDSLFQDVLDCQVQVTTGLQINRELWEDVITKQKNFTTCVDVEVIVFGEEYEKCTTYERLKKEIHLPTVPPPDHEDNLEAYKYLQAMSDYFCGIEKTFVETWEECKTMRDNRTELVPKCTTAQVDYEISICGWKTELVETCTEYSGCWEQAVERYNNRIAALSQLEDDQKAELEAIDKLDCLWEAWNYSSDPCIVNITWVKRCEEIPINFSNVTLKIYEVPTPQTCGPPQGGHDVALPCSDEFMNTAYGYLDLPKEQIDKMKEDCRTCPLSQEYSSSSSTTSTPKVVSDVKSEGQSGDDFELSLPGGKTTTKPTTTSTSKTTSKAEATIGTVSTSKTTSKAEVTIGTVSTSKTTSKAEVTIGTASTSKTTSKGEVTIGTVSTSKKPSDTTPEVVSDVKSEGGTGDDVSLDLPGGKTTPKPIVSTTSTCTELYSVELVGSTYNEETDRTEFEYRVTCKYGVEDVQHWDLIEFSDEQLGLLAESFDYEGSTQGQYDFEEDQGNLAIQAAGAVKCKEKPALLQAGQPEWASSIFKLNFFGAVATCPGEYRIQPVGSDLLTEGGCPCDVPCLEEVPFEPTETTTTTTTTTTTITEAPTTTTTTTLCPWQCQAPACADGDPSLGGWLLDDGVCTVASVEGEDGIWRCGLGEAFETDKSIYCHECIKQEATCICWGDPHIKPFDQRHVNTHLYDYGDFHMVQSEKVRIQGRYWSTRKDGNSQTRGLAFGGEFLKNNTLLVFPLDGKILWNGEEILADYPSSIKIAGLLYGEYHNEVDVARPRGRSHAGIRGVDLRMPMGVRATINRFRSHIDAVITVRKMEGGQDGHCGNFDDNPSDDNTRLIKDRMGDTVAPEDLLFIAKDYSYIGCYGERNHHRDLSVRKGSNMNHEECALACVDYTWFGIQRQQECWCGTEFGKYGLAEGCNCDGNVGANMQCIYGYFDSVQPPPRTLDDCEPDKFKEATDLCNGALKTEGLEAETVEEFLKLCMWDVCFGEPGFANDDAWAMHIQTPCATLADVQRICNKPVGPCGSGGGETPDHCKLDDCEEYKRLRWYRHQVRLLADGQARGDMSLTSIVQADHRPGICVRLNTLEICGSEQCSRTDMRFSRSDLAPLRFSSLEHGCLRDEASMATSFFIMSFKMKAKEVNGFYAIRASSGWHRELVRLVLHKGRLRLEARNGNPWFQEFTYTFTPGVEYDISVVFDGKEGSLKLFLGGKLEEAKTYHTAPQPVIKVGYIGCHDHNGRGHFRDAFAGTITDFYLQVRSTTITTTPEFKPVNFNSAKGCYRDNTFLESDYMKMSFTSKATSSPSWAVVRNDDRWLGVSTHIQFRGTKLEFAVRGANPVNQHFTFKFEANVEYNIAILYEKYAGTVKLYVNDELQQTKYYRVAPTLRMIPGFIGCWDTNGFRNFHRKFQGTMTNFMIESRPPSSPPPARKVDTIAIVVEGGFCSTENCISKVSCPQGMSVVACESDPLNTGNGAYVDPKTGECIVRGSGPLVRPRATCIKLKASSVRTEGLGAGGELSVKCPKGKAISCNCLGEGKVEDECSGMASFPPTADGVCKRTVGKATLFAICSDANVAIINGEPCKKDDCTSEAECPSGMSPVTCETSPWNSFDGAYLNHRSGVCTARGGWGNNPVNARATCMEATPTHAARTPVRGYQHSMGSLSVTCETGKPISCNCHSFFSVHHQCGGRAIFEPSNGACSALVGKATLYAVCPGEKPKLSVPANRLLLAKQKASSCYMASWTRTQFRMNPGKPDEDCYMDLGPLAQEDARDSEGNFWFQLVWAMQDGSKRDVMWKQTSLPTAEKVVDFEALSDDALDTAADKHHCTKFNGLRRSMSSSCVIDGSVGGCWWSCAGSTSKFRGDYIPATLGKVATGFELYVYTDEKLTTTTTTLPGNALLLARQTASSCYMLLSARALFKNNPYNPEAPCYMDLEPLSQKAAKHEDGYWFRLLWTLQDGETEEVLWRQESSLTENVISGFKPLNQEAWGASHMRGCVNFEGLGASDASNCVLDGNGRGGCWWNCAGTTTPFRGDHIPGPRAELAASFELYVLTETKLTTTTTTLPPNQLLLAKQKASECYMRRSAKTLFKNNAGDPKSSCYMNLEPLSQADARHSDGTFWFRLMWSFADGSTADVLWKQTSAPTEEAITGFESLNQGADRANAQRGCQQFKGLGKSRDHACVIDGNGGSGCWWNCAGSTGKFQGDYIPGPNNQKAVGFELFLLTDAPLTTTTTTLPSKEVLIARQTADDCYMAATAKDTFKTNEHDPTATCFMDLSIVSQKGARLQGTYWFRLHWVFGSGETEDVIWKQTSLPTEGSITGFEPVNHAAIDANSVSGCQAFNGLGKSTDRDCVIDGTGSDRCWWNCAGSVKGFHGDTIPGPRSTKAEGFELYIMHEGGVTTTTTTTWGKKFLLARQAATSCFMATTTKSDFKMNADNRNAACFMDLAYTELPEARQADGDLYFQLNWGLEDGSIEEVTWKQATVPTQGKIDGFTALNEPAVAAASVDGCQKFEGLGKSGDEGCVIDGTGSSECAWNCAGAIAGFDGNFIQGPHSSKVTEFSLNLLTTGPELTTTTTTLPSPSDGLDKVLLARQIAAECYMPPSAKTLLRYNTGNPGAPCYMDLSLLNQEAAMVNDVYRLQLEWQMEDGTSEVVTWQQTSSPTLPTVVGFEDINMGAEIANMAKGCEKFEGLALSANRECVLDGNGRDHCWWNCAGSTTPFRGNYIPGPSGRLARSFELFVFTADPDSFTTTTTTLPGGSQVTLARQTSSECYMDASTKTTFLMNAGDDKASCYMDLSYLSQAEARDADGNFWFHMSWTLRDDTKAEVVWKQKSMPNESTIIGFEAVSDDAIAADSLTNCAEFKGLGVSGDSVCVIDGTAGDRCWWNCAGSLSGFQGPYIPGPNQKRAKSFELRAYTHEEVRIQPVNLIRTPV